MPGENRVWGTGSCGLWMARQAQDLYRTVPHLTLATSDPKGAVPFPRLVIDTRTVVGNLRFLRWY